MNAKGGPVATARWRGLGPGRVRRGGVRRGRVRRGGPRLGPSGSGWVRLRPRPADLAQLAAAVVAVARLARARRGPARPARPVELPPGATVSVVIPALDDAARIGPCLDALGRDPQVIEVIVVDGGSVDATAGVARSAGATVVAAGPPPPGWSCRGWALARGARAAAGDWVLALDPGARPEPGLVGAAVTAADAYGHDAVAVAPRYDDRRAGPIARIAHPSLLAARAYRPGPVEGLANAPCVLLRQALAAGLPDRAPARPGGAPDPPEGTNPGVDGGADGGAGVEVEVGGAGAGLAGPVAGHAGHVGTLDGTALLTVGIDGEGVAAGRVWGRGLPWWPDDGAGWTAGDLAVLWLAMALPPLRLVSGRGSVLDLVLVAARVGLAARLRRRYAGPHAWVWLSPVADLPVAARLTVAALRGARSSPDGGRDARTARPRSERGRAAGAGRRQAGTGLVDAASSSSGRSRSRMTR